MNRPVPHILITRPSGQHTTLVEACEKLGLKVSHVACLRIEPIDEKTLLDKSVAHTDIILFTSQNAVFNAHKQRPLPWPGVQVHAIGTATARLLSTLGQTLSLLPSPPYNSESYVQQLESLQPQRLTIIKGVDGRSHIAEQLQHIGWSVSSVDVYCRALPSESATSLLRIFEHDPPDIISIGSNETLLNLMLLTKPHINTVLEIPLIVNSERCSELARSIGFLQPSRISVPAGDQGQLSALADWLLTR